MTPRLYTDAQLNDRVTVNLGAEQSHYLKLVMRRQTGDSVLLFNGRDGEYLGEILSIKKNNAHVKIKSQTRKPAALSGPALFFAPVKRAGVEMIIQKGTELGVKAFFPVITARTQFARLRLERLRAIAIEAAEQSGRLCAPTLSDPQPLTQTLDQWPARMRLIYCDEAGDDPDQRWGGEKGRAPPAASVLERYADQKSDWGILIGPEGGFALEERQMLRSQKFVTPVSLGPRILRADTAAIAALTVWQAVLGDWR